MKIFTLRRIHSEKDRKWNDFSKHLGMKVYPISQQKALIKARKRTRMDIKKFINKHNKKHDTDIKIL